MEGILDQLPVEQNRNTVKYGGFWVRLGALLIDGLVLAPLSFGVAYFNMTNWKSVPVLVVLSLLGLAYKPLMENTYGATLGKMALRLQVVDLNFEKATFGTILLRNIFNIIPGLFSLFLSVQIYTDPDFQSISGFAEFAQFSQSYGSNQLMSSANGLLMIVEAIMIGVDEQKRSLHDRIAGTYVIEKP